MIKSKYWQISALFYTGCPILYSYILLIPNRKVCCYISLLKPLGSFCRILNTVWTGNSRLKSLRIYQA